jgi:FAD/FMN-containing dehydrogenase
VERAAHIARLSVAAASSHDYFTAKEIADLQGKLIGTIVVSTSPDYDSARQVSNRNFQAFPAAIAYCQVIDDVWHCLAFARRHHLQVICRSGGHSTAGFSTQNSAFLIDVSRLSYVVVDPAARRARVGAGTQLGVLNSTLNHYHLHTPGGGCPNVGVAGHMMGGGFGWTSREFGMNCDNVVEVVVMLADGRVVRANAQQNADLLWAVCGGTGNNFGVLLEITYRLHDLWTVWGFGIGWPLDGAPEVLATLQRDFMLDAAPRTLGYQVPFVTMKGQKMLLIRGLFNGPPDAGRRLLAPLLKFPGAEMQVDTVGSYYELNEGLLEKPQPIPDIPDAALEAKFSGYFGRQLSAAEWREVTTAFSRDASGWATGNLEVYGGAINALPGSTNAFVHRDVYADWFLDVFWETDDQRAAAEQFLADMVTALKPLQNGHVNQDYVRRDQPDYRWAYFGNAFETLLFVKRKYDPQDVFHFAQGISPYPPGYSGPRSTASSLFTDTSIAAEPWSQPF